MGRISELPESVLHHILSFLSQKQAIQTSALSKPWRHVGDTRPKVEFTESLFGCSCIYNKKKFASILDNTLRWYNHHNLSVQEFILEMRRPDPIWVPVIDKLIPMLLNDMGVRKFDLTIPFYAVDPSVAFGAEHLTELYLSECKLMTSSTTTADDHGTMFSNKRLKTLSLKNVQIEEATLDKIIRSCALIEHVILSDCVGLATVQLAKSRNSNNIKHFSCSLCASGGRSNSIEIDVPTIETVRIANCTNWYSHYNYYFPRLKSLHLCRVRLSAQLLNSLSSNVPSLEELELKICNGFQEIQLTVCSIKRLVIGMDWKKAIKTTIYAPNINYFEFSGDFPPQLIFHTEAGREWKSHVAMSFYNRSYNNALPWLLQLSETLNALNQSRISLDVSARPFKNLKVEDTHDGRFYKPVAVEHVRFKGEEYCPPYSYPDFLNCLFLICRPRYIGMSWYTMDAPPKWKNKNNNLDMFIMSKIILQQEKMCRGYYWERDLEEISTQVWDDNLKGWHPFQGTTSFFEFTTMDQNIRFRLKWRDSLLAEARVGFGSKLIEFAVSAFGKLF